MRTLSSERGDSVGNRYQKGTWEARRSRQPGRGSARLPFHAAPHNGCACVSGSVAACAPSRSVRSDVNRASPCRANSIVTRDPKVLEYAVAEHRGVKTLDPLAARPNPAPRACSPCDYHRAPPSALQATFGLFASRLTSSLPPPRPAPAIRCKGNTPRGAVKSSSAERSICRLRLAAQKQAAQGELGLVLHHSGVLPLTPANSIARSTASRDNRSFDQAVLERLIGGKDLSGGQFVQRRRVLLELAPPALDDLLEAFEAVVDQGLKDLPLFLGSSAW